MEMKAIKYTALAVLLAACGSAGGPGAASTTSTMSEQITTTVADESTTTEDVEAVPLPAGFPDSLLEEIISDASDRTGTPEQSVEVVSVEASTFGDTSLGCPEEGKMYAQVITPGFTVILDAEGEELDYRVAEGSDTFILCEN